MARYRVSDIAALLGVSDDTVRRYIDGGSLPAERDGSRRLVVDGVALAEFARSSARSPRDPSEVSRSARNRLVGLVTAVESDRVMAQVEMQCGPHRVVSLMSAEALAELGLQPGVLAVAVGEGDHGDGGDADRRGAAAPVPGRRRRARHRVAAPPPGFGHSQPTPSPSRSSLAE